MSELIKLKTRIKIIDLKIEKLLKSKQKLMTKLKQIENKMPKHKIKDKKRVYDIEEFNKMDEFIRDYIYRMTNDDMSIRIDNEYKYIRSITNDEERYIEITKLYDSLKKGFI